ncbi:MAG: Fic family protein [Mycobacteriales bacterium]
MRSYEESHPWISFKATDINDLDPKLWMLLGEARSKCQHLAGTPLRPDVAQHFYEVTLIKGAQATAAIEGNTLTEEQVEGIYRGTYKAPPSRAYQEREIRNVLEALMEIDTQVTQGNAPSITPELICDYNRRVLEGTEYEPHVLPGEIRDYSVGVPGYRGAPAEDCKYLVDRLAEWLEGDLFRSEDPELEFALAIVCAIYAHLYIAWIHPFGDGNGRTARLLEFLILARCGMVPLPAAHLLSNHYNLTRDQYYRELAEASRTRRTVGLVAYAVQGLVDGIRDQIEQVRIQQFSVTWINFVHETMGQFPSSPTRDRQRSLVLAMPSGKVLPRAELEGLTPKLAALYAKAGPRTLTRDLNRLRAAGLIVRRKNGWVSNDSVIRAFLPPIADAAATHS